jgi:hypothetical protein
MALLTGDADLIRTNGSYCVHMIVARKRGGGGVGWGVVGDPLNRLFQTTTPPPPPPPPITLTHTHQIATSPQCTKQEC